MFVALAGGASDDNSFDVPGTLAVLAERGPEVLGADAASVVLTPGKGDEAQVAGSSPEASLLEREALKWAEGPGHDCRRSGTRPVISRFGVAGVPTRWPSYTPRALKLGYTHVVAFSLAIETPRPADGAFILLSRSARAFTPETVALGRSVSDFAALLLRRAGEAERGRKLTAQLEHALTSRIGIEQAKGVVAAHTGLSVDASFERLRRYARSHQRPLNEVAREVVQGTADPEMLEPPHAREPSWAKPRVT
ncbi:hypothetical protein B1H18_15480 [Streptomyces tsukubensis]|uniref:ANTAR domain-containing protein n=2 Tax=Streptomyces tsukubensis TaxID=83656 RepID=A0A1V4A9J5_9ACTN|nr:hypothetical protein B1H18_15480 [Streptomyces tsukubensis]